MVGPRLPHRAAVGAPAVCSGQQDRLLFGSEVTRTLARPLVTGRVAWGGPWRGRPRRLTGSPGADHPGLRPGAGRGGPPRCHGGLRRHYRGQPAQHQPAAAQGLYPPTPPTPGPGGKQHQHRDQDYDAYHCGLLSLPGQHCPSPCRHRLPVSGRTATPLWHTGHSASGAVQLIPASPAFWLLRAYAPPGPRPPTRSRPRAGSRRTGEHRTDCRASALAAGTRDRRTAGALALGK